MKRYIVALIYMALCMPLVSCDKEVQEQYGDSSAYLPISDMENLYPLGDSVNVSFTSDLEWTVTAYEGTNDEATKTATWLEFNNRTLKVQGNFGGVGTTDLEITIEPYIEKDSILEKTAPREATIIFKSKIGDKKTLKEFKVSQERAYFKIVESNDSTSERNDIKDSISFDWKKEQRKYEVESNFNWKLNINNGSVDNATVKVKDSVWNPKTLYGIGTNKLSVEVDYNFSKRQENVISFIPCFNNDDDKGEKVPDDEQYNVLRRKLNVIQDYRYLKVVDSSIDSTNPNNLTTKKAFENLSELGNEDVVDFYVVYEEDLEYNINIKPSEAALKCFEYYEADGNNSGKCSEPDDDNRNIYWKKYSAKFTKANPDFVNPRTITCYIKPCVEGVPDDACLSVEFVQNAYEFNVKDGAGTDVTEIEIDNKGGSESFTLTTKGDWKISYPKANDWAELTFRDQDGNTINCELKSDVFEVSERGNVTIDVTVKNQNLSFDHNQLVLELVALDIKETKNVNLKQLKYTWNVNCDKGYPFIFEPVYSDDKSYTGEIRIESSGSWEVEVTDDKDMLQPLSQTSGTGNKDLTFIINPNDTASERSVDIKIINVDLVETEPETATKTITLKQKAYIEVTPNPIVLDSTKGSSESITIKTSANDGNWSFTQDEKSKTWLEVKKNEGNLDVKTKSQNKTKNSRVANITVTDETSGQEITITVTQKG